MIDGKQFSITRPSNAPILMASRPCYKVDKDEHEEVPDEDILISSHRVMGFSLANKSWGFFRIELLENVIYNDNVFEQLVLPKIQKDMVKALVAAHEIEKIGFDDIIKDKGKGMTILLHGTPGVGKTLTAGNHM